MPKKSSKPGLTTASSTTLPSIPMYLPSGVQTIEDWLTSLREDSPARTSAPPGNEPDSMEIAAASGGKCLDAFARWDPDMSLLRTFQASLLEGKPEQWLESWPASVTVRLHISSPPPR